MSGRSRQFIGTILTVAGSAIPGLNFFVAAALIGGGMALSMSGARSEAREAQRRARAAQNSLALRGNVRGTHEHHLLVFGKARVGGIIVAEGTLDGPDMPAQYFYLGVAHSICHEGGCEGFEAVWLDDTRIPAADIDDVTGEVTAGPFAGLVKLTHYRGTGTQGADPDLTANNLDYSTAWRRGIQWTLARFKRPTDSESFVNAFKGRFPVLTVESKGIRCYDPRKDSTNGGSGTHRYNDVLTWEWTDNFILQSATFSIMKKLHGGEGIPPENIVWTTVAAAANVADELITTPAGQQKRFRGNGALISHDKNSVNLQKLLDAGLGKRVEVGGMFEFHCASWRAPTFTIDHTWLAGPVEFLPRGRIESNYNSVRINFNDATQDYKTIEAPSYINAAYETEDGGERVTRDLNLPMVSDGYQAQYLSQIVGKKSRDQWIIELSALNLKALDIKPWETGVFSLPGFEAEFAGKYFRIEHWTTGANGVSVVLEEDKPSNYDVEAFQSPVVSDPPVLEIEGTSPPNNVVAIAVADGIRITWTPPYAPSFNTIEIYRSNNPSSGFVSIGEVARRTSYFVDGVTDGATWYYKLAARTNFGTYSGFSAVVSATAKQAADGSSQLASNLGFESGSSGWAADSGRWTVVQESPRTGTWAAKFTSTGSAQTDVFRNSKKFPVSPGDLVLAYGYLVSSAGANGTARWRVCWLDSASTVLSTSDGTLIAPTATYTQSRVSSAAPANAAYARLEVVGTSISAGSWWADDGYCVVTPKSQDEIPDGTTYGRPRLTALTSGEIDLSKAGVINRSADNITESGTRKWAAESGAQVVTGKSIDILVDGGTYGRTKLTALTAGEVDLSKAGVIGRTLGNIADDATYGRTKLTALTSGEVDLSKAGVLNRNADNLAESATRKWAAESGAQVVTGKSIDILADGGTYGRTKLTALTAGEVDLSKAGVLNRNLDNVADSSGFKRVQTGTLAARPAAGTAGRFYLASDGGGAGKPVLYRDTGSAWEVASAASLANIIDASADNISESGSRKWAAESGAQVVTGKSIDILVDGATYGRTKLTALTAGEVDLSKAGVLNRNLDNVADSSGFKRVQTGTLAARPAAGTAGRFYLASDGGGAGKPVLYRDTGSAWEVASAASLANIIDASADNISESGSRKWAAESGAQVVTGKSIDILVDGATYGRTKLTALTAGEVDLSKAGVIGRNLGNIADDATYGRTKLTALTSGEVDLTKAGVLNRNADNLAESATRKWAAESGADVTAGKSVNVLVDVKTVAQFFTFTQTITAPGAGSVTIPTGAKTLVMRAWGGGGSGSRSGTGAPGAGAARGAGGGGAGCKKTVIIRAADHGGTISYNVGAGGASKATTGSGNAGAATTVTSSGLSFTNLNLNAGGGGAGTNAPAGGAAGTASGGDTNTSGNAGNTGVLTTGGNSATIDSLFGVGGFESNPRNGEQPGAGGCGGGVDASGAGGNGMVTFTWTG